MFVSRMYVFEMQLARRTAAMIIQRQWREFMNMGPSEMEIVYSMTRIQAMYRGKVGRAHFAFLLQQREKEHQRFLERQEMERQRRKYEDQEEKIRQRKRDEEEKLKQQRALAPVKEQQPLDNRQLTPAGPPGRMPMVVYDNAQLEDLFHEIVENNWAVV